MEFITAVQTQLVATAEQAVQGYEGSLAAASLSAMEQAVQGLLQAVGQTVLSGWLERQEAHYPPDTVACACGCGRGVCPLHEPLGIVPGQLSNWCSVELGRDPNACMARSTAFRGRLKTAGMRSRRASGGRSMSASERPGGVTTSIRSWPGHSLISSGRGFEVGAQQADELIFVADGASWIWNIVERHFPNAVQIVDFYPAASYLTSVARAAFGETTPEGKQWVQTHIRQPHDGALSTVVRACMTLATYAPEAVAKARRYFAVNCTRLRYATFRARGYQIGSGTMESGCKQLGLERLKIAGAGWSQQGGRLQAKARAAVLSHELNRYSCPLPQVA